MGVCESGVMINYVLESVEAVKITVGARAPMHQRGQFESMQSTTYTKTRQLLLMATPSR